MRPIAVTLTSLALFTLATTQLHAEEINGARTRPGAEAEVTVERFIVKLRGSLSVQATAGNGESVSTQAAAAAKQRISALASRTKMTMRETHAVGPALHVMQVSPVSKGEAMNEMLTRLRADSEVEYAVPDRRVYAHAMSNDPRAAGQWYLQSTQPSAINAFAAWDTTKGSDGVVIAVIDTGVRFEHPDIKAAAAGGRLLPGYDFVSEDSPNNFKTANDGSGRDADASDPGDWVTSGDACGSASDSSWHGTRVSGIIGALTDNAVGVAGVTWFSKLLPVRVIGKCGGFNSDVLAGMNWAAGETVPGVPANPNPAKVLNISLGGEGSCDSASADVVSMLASKGVLIVVSAGNEGGPVDSPANCPGAMGIAGLRHAGTKVGFSSLGPEIALSAPAGNCVDVTGASCQFSIDTTSNSGTTVPASSTYTDQINRNIGTSFSAPIVSGIAGLMLAVNSNLKSTQLIARLKEGATKPFPTTSETGTPPVCHTPTGPTDIQPAECSCTTSVCGAGMANANGSVQAALRPIADIVAPGSITPGANLTLQGAGSSAANGHSVTTYAWTKGGASISTSTTANVVAPTSGTTSVCLTVTDDAGKQDTAKIAIGPTTATVSSVTPGASACMTDITIAATDASAAETGDTGTFTLTRSGDTTGALAVAIAVSGSGVNGTNYQSIASSVNFTAGASTATVTVTPIDNSAVDGAKTVTLTIQSGTGYNAGSPSSATVTISDNDVAPASAGGGGGGGGGGALDQLMLMGLAFAVFAALARAHLPRHAKQLRQHIATEERRARR
jgi:serine protease